jgi:U4/U6 small nuclear ribonucleoprotein PRP4
MSDDEEIVYAKRQKTIHYGTLEETMEARMKILRNEPEVQSQPTAPIKADIPEYFDIDTEV